MRVVWLIQNLVPYHHARFERFAKNVDGEAHLIQVTDQDDFGVLKFKALEQAYNLHTLFQGEKRSSISQEKLKLALNVFLTKINPTCICVSGWGMEIGLLIQSWALQHRIPTVLFCVSTEIDEQRRWHKEFVKRQFVDACSSYFGGGQSQVRYLKLLGASEELCVTGHNVVDTAHFSAESAAPIQFKKLKLFERFFVSCTRFGAKKNIPRLIKAYASYRKTCIQNSENPYQLVIAGEGELRGEIERTIAEMEVLDSVKLLGAVDYNSLPWLYQNAEAFVHASTSEQWGLVINEAMAAGLPVLISERCGCALDLVDDDNNGFKFDPYDEKEIALSMLKFHRLSDDKKEAFRERSRAIISYWGPDRFSNGLTQAITKALIVGPKKNTLLIRILLKLLLRRSWQ